MVVRSVENTKPIHLKISEEEYSLIEDKAKRIGLNVSGYVRLVLLTSEISCEIEEKYKKTPSEIKNKKHIHVRVMPDEHRKIKNRAKKLGLTLAGYVRFTSVNSEVEVIIKTNHNDINNDTDSNSPVHLHKNTGKKFVLKKEEESDGEQLTRKTTYFKTKNWDYIEELKKKTGQSKTQILNKALEYAFKFIEIK